MRTSTLLRCVALGKAAGMRGAWGLAGPAFSSSTGPGRRVSVLSALAVETAADKHPSVPDRLSVAGLAPRLLSGAAGAWLLARRQDTGPVPAVLAGLAGLAGVVAGSLAGVRWRSWAGERRPGWQGALVEDAVAAGVAMAACRRTAPE